MAIFSFFSSEPTVELNPEQRVTMPTILSKAGIKPKLYNDFCIAMDELRFEDALRLAQEIDHFVYGSAHLSYLERKNESAKYTQIARLNLAEQKLLNGDNVAAYRLFYQYYEQAYYTSDEYRTFGGSFSGNAPMLRNIGLHLEIEIAALLNALEAMQLQDDNLDTAEQIIEKLTDIVGVYRPGEAQFSQYKLWQTKIANMKSMQGLNVKVTDLIANLNIKKIAHDKYVLQRYALELDMLIKKFETLDNLNFTTLERVHACNEKLTKIKVILFIHEIIQHQQHVLTAIDEFDLSRAQKYLQSSISAFSEYNSDQINDIAKEFNLAKKQNLSRKSFVLALNNLQMIMNNIKQLQPTRELSASVLEKIRDKVVGYLNRDNLTLIELDMSIHGFDQEVLTIIDKDFYKLILLTELELDIYINGIANILVDNVTELSTLERYRYWTNAGVRISEEPKVLRELQIFTKDFTTTQVENQAKRIRAEILATLSIEDNAVALELAPTPISPASLPEVDLTSRIEVTSTIEESESAPSKHTLQKRH